MKKCNKCKRDLDFSEFSSDKSAKDGFNAKCKICDAIARTKRRSRLEAHYSDYERFLNNQNGKCAICESCDPGKKDRRRKRFCLDHDHKTGKVRGLLCITCNRAIGLLGDDVESIKRCLKYLAMAV